MKWSFFLILFFFGSCQSSSHDYSISILKDGVVATSFVEKIDKPGRMLLGWYLFAYGNECVPENDKPKCQILNLLGVENECDTHYIHSLKSWFQQDVYRNIKLKNCPSLPVKGAIQNEFKYLAIDRHQDTISISFRVDGMNNSQEKSWNTERVERFLVKGDQFVFLVD